MFVGTQAGIGSTGHAEANFLAALVLDARGQPAKTEALLHEAGQAAQAAGDPVLQIRTWGYLVLALGDHLGRPRETRMWLGYAEAGFEGIGKHDGTLTKTLRRQRLRSGRCSFAGKVPDEALRKLDHAMAEALTENDC